MQPPVLAGAMNIHGLSIVVPVFNESGNIRPLCDEIRRALEGRVRYEVLYVDDASNDGTAAVLAELAAAGEIRVTRHARRCGQSAGLLTGVRAARHPVVATLDGDGQNDPADIPRMLEVFADCGEDRARTLVIGHRVRRRDSWLRRIASRVANAVRSQVLQDDTPDTGCGIKLFTREGFLALPWFDHMHRFLPALYRRAGGNVVSVPVHHRPRQRGSSKYGINDRLWPGIVDMLGVVWLARRYPDGYGRRERNGA